jgi:ATP-dependent DNA helicase DinG
VEFTGETPFDYDEVRSSAYFPTDLPDPDEDDYFERLTKRLRTIIRRRRGRCLVLFTSADLMRKVHDDLRDRVEYHCYVQGEASKNVLIEHFKSDIGSCLFATRSFFTGVDIPGEALSTVVLIKAPFRVPSDPLFKAKCDKIKQRGGEDFSGYSMPLMLMDVRQAFGRLIRSIDDTGMFCFLDSRALKKAYGKRIKNSLPKMRIVDQVEEC